MLNCEGCQNLLLDFLYDLLEPAEREALQAHLATCPACPAALAKVRQQQGLFATAAKMAFPAVRFIKPAPVPILPLPRSQPLQPRRRWAAAAALWLAGFALSQWVVSAAVMGAIFLVVGVATWFASDYATARQAVAHHEVEVAALCSGKESLVRPAPSWRRLWNGANAT